MNDTLNALFGIVISSGLGVSSFCFGQKVIRGSGAGLFLSIVRKLSRSRPIRNARAHSEESFPSERFLSYSGKAGTYSARILEPKWRGAYRPATGGTARCDSAGPKYQTMGHR